MGNRPWVLEFWFIQFSNLGNDSSISKFILKKKSFITVISVCNQAGSKKHKYFCYNISAKFLKHMTLAIKHLQHVYNNVKSNLTPITQCTETDILNQETNSNNEVEFKKQDTWKTNRHQLYCFRLCHTPSWSKKKASHLVQSTEVSIKLHER